MPARKGCVYGRNQSESRNAATDALYLGWSASSDQLTGARMGSGDAVFHGLPTQLVNRIRSHIPGACSP